MISTLIGIILGVGLAIYALTKLNKIRRACNPRNWVKRNGK